MGKLTLSMLLDEYAKYREQRNESEKTAKATHQETCRQNFNDILNVMGIDSKLFKDPFNERSYHFVEADKNLVFELLDRFSSRDFVLMRKGRYLEVPVVSLRFYLKALSTLLERLEIDAEVIRDQKEQMIRQTSYMLAIELQNVHSLMEGIKQDIDQILEETQEKDDDIRYLDSIARLSDLGKLLHLLRERTRYVYHIMDTDRDQEELSISSGILRNDPDAKDRIKKLVRLDQVLLNNEKYIVLTEELGKLADEVLFSKKKRFAFLKAVREIEEISDATQIQEFGEPVAPISGGKKMKMPLRMSSEEALDRSVEAYMEMLVLQSMADDPDDVPIAVDLAAQRFDGNTDKKRVDKDLNSYSIFKIVLAVHLDMDWNTMEEGAYKSYSAFSNLKQEEFEILVNEAATECEELFRSFPKLYQTKLDLDIHDEIQAEIITKLELKFEAFLP